MNLMKTVKMFGKMKVSGRSLFPEDRIVCISKVNTQAKWHNLAQETNHWYNYIK